MNNEQLRKEFEAWVLGESPTPAYMKSVEKDGWGGYVPMKTRTDWIAYQAAAKSRDELIGKLVKALELSTEFRTGNPAYEQICAVIEPYLTKEGE